MRIAHATDLHWTAPVPWGRLPGKRLLGTANQIFRGRRYHFPRQVQRDLVAHLLALEPDLVILTGDLTAQALPEEFAMAREDLAPVLERFPTVIVPGNHDVYTRGAQRDDRIAQFFGPWLHRAGPIGRMDIEHVTVLTLDPNRPTFLDATGEVPQDQLDALHTALDDPALQGRAVVLALHYPLLDPRGEVYDGPRHGLLNARSLIELLRSVRTPPRLILHGHEHRAYRVELMVGNTTIPIVDCGSSGHRHEAVRRASMAVHTVPRHGEVSTERYLHDGACFTPAGPFPP